MLATLILGSIFFVFYISYYLFMTRLSGRVISLAGESGYRPKVSIVVPTYNEEATIKKKLINLMAQDYQGEVEMIIIDSASSDRTVGLAEKFCQDKGLKATLLKEEKREGKANALNYAFGHCTGDIVVMTDADAIWEETTLSRAILNFSSPEIGAVTGRQILLNPEQSVTTRTEATYRRIYEVLRLGESVLDTTPIFHGEISCYRRQLLDKISNNSMADDSELAVKVRRRGYRAIYDATAVFYEYAPPTIKSRFNQKVRRGQGLIQLFLREWHCLFNPKYGKFGTIILPAEFFMHVISPSVLFALILCAIYELITLNLHFIIAIGIFLLLAGIVLSLKRINVVNFAVSFLSSQFILLVSLLYQIVGRSQHKWRKIAEIRELHK